MRANEAQKSAITHVNGPMMVLAGPGSGKTYVITERIRYLIEEAHIHPEHILVITFTNAAAVQMEKRFQKRIGSEQVPVCFGTFHAVYFHILQKHTAYRAKDILQQEDQYRFLREIIKEQKLEVAYPTEWMSDILSQISCIKNQTTVRTKAEYLDSVYPAYMNKCQHANKLDFDDMLILCYKLLKSREEILHYWQKVYRYFLIDEFQDINCIQYEIIQMLSAPERNLFIVGDDDQSIYGFRGARPEIMLHFEKDYKECQRVILNMNYRSHSEIVKLAHNLIRHNKKRFQKKLLSHKGSGGTVIYKQYANLEQEITAVKKEIENSNAIDDKYNDVAILYRTGISERLLMKMFRDEIERGLTLSTIHAAKGLEYDVVFILDIIKGNIPHRKAKKKQEIEEERRLFYVAITRAKRKIYLFSVKKHLEKQADTSAFIREIRSSLK